jgi:hypothetical protein
MFSKKSDKLFWCGLMRMLSWRIRKSVINEFLFMRSFGFFFLLLCLYFNGSALAQPSPNSSQEGNLGIWKWGQQQPAPQKEEPEDTDEATDQERGGTSWERMRGEREPAPEEEQEAKTLTPLEIWRMIREKLW